MVIHMLTGPIGAGKTTWLANWCQQRHDAGGILTPVLAGKRYFKDIFLQEWRPMEAGRNEEAVQQVGRYVFSDASFGWASQRLLQAAGNPLLNWLVIDEIGPLELRGGGFHPALDHLFYEMVLPRQVVLVVRQQLVQAVLDQYDLYRFRTNFVPLEKGMAGWPVTGIKNGNSFTPEIPHTYPPYPPVP